MRLSGMTMRALVAAGGVAVLAGCGGDTPDPTPGEPFEYGTHCGVGATSIDGTTYYPTAVYDGDEPITGSDPSWYTSAGGPTPWITVEGDQVVYEDGAADMNTTHGTIERLDADGTAIFHVKGGRWSIHLSDDPADAAWTIDGCA